MVKDVGGREQREKTKKGEEVFIQAEQRTASGLREVRGT